MEGIPEILHKAYAAFNRREVDVVLSCMQPDVSWPNVADGVQLHGHDEVREYWRQQWEQVDPHVEPTRIQAEDESGKTVVQVHQVVRDRAGHFLVDQMVQHVYVFRDGLIASMEIRAM